LIVALYGREIVGQKDSVRVSLLVTAKNVATDIFWSLPRTYQMESVLTLVSGERARVMVEVAGLRGVAEFELAVDDGDAVVFDYGSRDHDRELLEISYIVEPPDIFL